MKRRIVTLHARRYLESRRAAAVAVFEDAVEFAVAEKGERIRKSGRLEGPTDEVSAAGRLQRAFAAIAEFQPPLVVGVMPAHHVPLRRLTPPFRDAKRLARTLDSLLEIHLPFDLDAVKTDHILVTRGNRVEGDVLSIACPADPARRTAARIAAQGEAPSILDHELVALFNYARFRGVPAGIWSVVRVGKTRCAWVFGEDDRLLGGRALLLEDPEGLPAEWERSRLAIPETRSWQATDETVRLLGDPGGLDPCARAMRETLGFLPAVMNPPAEESVAAVACGAALRGTGRGIAVDLLPTPPQARPAFRPIRQAIWATAAAALFVLLIPVVGSLGRGALAVPRLRAVNRALLETAQRAGVPSPPPAQEVYALRRALDGALRRSELYAPLDAPPVSDRLDRLVTALPRNVRIERISLAPRRVVLRAAPADPAAAPAYADALRRAFDSVSIKTLPGSGALARFEIVVGREVPAP